MWLKVCNSLGLMEVFQRHPKDIDIYTEPRQISCVFFLFLSLVILLVALFGVLAQHLRPPLKLKRSRELLYSLLLM